MKRNFLALIGIASAFLIANTAIAQIKKTAPAKSSSVAAKPRPASAKPVLRLANYKDSISYAFGMNLALNFRNQNMDRIVDPTIMGQAIKDVFNESPTPFPQGHALTMMAEFVANKNKAQQEENTKAAGGNKEIGRAFLNKNKTKPGVVTTESGLQYLIEKEGTGAKPTPTDKVKVHYTGRLLNSKVFDSSVQRGQPAEFGVTEVIKGWTEALQLMTVGSKYKFYIPSELAYGDRGTGSDIEPGKVRP
jgi:FKBP-type peptidyl-prolyl cis-trans isomerase FklB